LLFSGQPAKAAVGPNLISPRQLPLLTAVGIWIANSLSKLNAYFPWVPKIPHYKRHFDRFIRFCRDRDSDQHTVRPCYSVSSNRPQLLLRFGLVIKGRSHVAVCCCTRDSTVTQCISMVTFTHMLRCALVRCAGKTLLGFLQCSSARHSICVNGP